MKFTTILAIFAISTLPAISATISFNVDTDTGFATSTDVALDSGYTAYFGNYTGGALSSTATYAEINANFDVLTSQNFSTGDVAGSDGYVVLNEYTFTDAAGFGGKQLYMFVTDGANMNALLSGFGTIPSDTDTVNSKAFFIDSNNVASLTYHLGSYDSESPNLAGSGGNIILVPEPSVALLGVVSVLGLLRRRR